MGAAGRGVMAVLAMTVGSCSAAAATAVQPQHLIFELDASVKINTNNQEQTATTPSASQFNISTAIAAAIAEGATIGAQSHIESPVATTQISRPPMHANHTVFLPAGSVPAQPDTELKVVDTSEGTVWACGVLFGFACLFSASMVFCHPAAERLQMAAFTRAQAALGGGAKPEQLLEKERAEAPEPGDKWRLTALAAANAFVCDLYMTLVMTFLPMESEVRGVSEKTTGFMFSLTPVGILITSAITPGLMRRFSPGIILPVSTSLAAVCSLGTGLLAMLHNDVSFGVMMCFSRLLQGCAVGLSEAVFTALLIRRFPAADLQQPISIVMASKSTASMIGPFLGGATYDAAGFSMPFLIGGTLILLSAVAQCFMLQAMFDGSEVDKGSVQFKQVCSYQYSLLVVVAVTFLSAWFMTEPLVAVWWHSEPYNLSSTMIGVVSVVASLYGNMVLLFGAIVGPKVGAVLVIAVAAWIGMLSSWVYAPAPFLPFINKSLVQLCIGVAGMTTAQNLTLPAIQPLLVLVCERRHLNRDGVASIVSATNLMAFGVAGAASPLISGGLFQHDFVPVEWIVTGWCFSFGLIGLIVPFFLWDLQLLLTRGPPPAATASTGPGGD